MQAKGEGESLCRRSIVHNRHVSKQQVAKSSIFSPFRAPQGVSGPIHHSSNVRKPPWSKVERDYQAPIALNNHA